MCFSLKIFEFSELCQFCCSASVLPAWRVYTHRHWEKTESGKYIKIFEKTQYLINTLYFLLWRPSLPHLVLFSYFQYLFPQPRDYFISTIYVCRVIGTICNSVFIKNMVSHYYNYSASNGINDKHANSIHLIESYRKMANIKVLKKAKWKH